ncbi:HNH endonuclease [Corynebacterium camporealensis]|uniref:HNH endonuclease n=1 Tax=Corynebacterium camporealensis TaxID=161896 RepID=A0A0F6QVV0_9CORY|nr:HNH endonuclease signature motif containing protein [Corynebacterium camporealensis]AKE39042.1 HNH endonuclease [Corynebacterium camporealensis]AVH88271.1 HNH endonuclease [Corynebacterium camporealensis]
MKAVKAYAASLATPMDILSEVAMLTRAHLQLEGLPQKEITALMSLADVYFGQTPYTRLQATARNTPHSLLVLKDIENKARRIKDPVQRYKFRIACAEVHEDDINAVAKEFLPPPPEPKEGTKMKRSKTDKWSWSVTGRSELISKLNDAFPDTEAVDEFLQTGTTKGTAVTTNVVIKLDELDKIVDGEGDDVVLQMTNGAKLTGAQLVQQMFTDHGYATLIHPVEGPVNLYRTQRQASWKQRMMAAAENPVCPWKDCLKGADECQVHHIVAWKYGGETNQSNLTTACKFHNGRNDDDGVPRYGCLLRIRGEVQWVPPSFY